MTSLPSLYQVNTRVRLTELSTQLGRQATLDDITNHELEQYATKGFDWIWLLSVWQTGLEGQRISRQHPEWLNEFRDTLRDLKEEDIVGSGFAICAYEVADTLGGNAALARLYERMKKKGLKLMLDFVPNHVAMDHPWVHSHPEYFVQGTKEQLKVAPENFKLVKGKKKNLIIAHGRDPYFPGWPDTFQLNYGNASLQTEMVRTLTSISGMCDGVRCDMAMLILPEVFERTWGIKAQPFWGDTIKKIKTTHPDFVFMAEVYWDMEWTLQKLGFDFTYDKRLYDRLLHGPAVPVREHFYAGLPFQNKLARFLENHDEQRAASAFPVEKHEAAAVITFFSPGMRFFHQGQLEGRRIKISPHIVRAPEEQVDDRLKQFYDKLIENLLHVVFRNGQWQLLECKSAWEGNYSNEGFIAFAWEAGDREHHVVVVNYSTEQGQCYVRLPFDNLNGSLWQLRDLFTGTVYERNGSELATIGLYMDEPGWKYYIFSLTRTAALIG